MNISEIRKVVDELNTYIMKSLWMDFEMRQYSRNRLSVYGGTDLLYSHEIEIIFEDIFFVSLPIEWKTDTKSTALRILDGEEARTINIMYMVEQGFTLFSFKPEDYPKDFGCIIGAKNVSYKVIKLEK